MSHQNCSHDHSHEHESHVGHDEKSNQIDANSQVRNILINNTMNSLRQQNFMYLINYFLH